MLYLFYIKRKSKITFSQNLDASRCDQSLVGLHLLDPKNCHSKCEKARQTFTFLTHD